MWSKDEINTLSMISQMLSTFLLKKMATDRDRVLAVRLNTILDMQDAYIYAVVEDNYELLYLNHKTKELDPNIEIGMTCYKAFYSRQTSCETCPLSGRVVEIYNPQYNLWNRTKAAPMKWGFLDAYLVTRFDITEYRRVRE